MRQFQPDPAFDFQRDPALQAKAIPMDSSSASLDNLLRREEIGSSGE